MPLRPAFLAASIVVPVPQNGSSTVSPQKENILTIRPSEPVRERRRVVSMSNEPGKCPELPEPFVEVLPRDAAAVALLRELVFGSRPASVA